MIAKDQHSAHGLEGSFVEPDWPPLTLDEVDGLLRRFPDAGGARRILSHSPRPFSTASVVETPRGAVFVKRHPGRVRDREGLLEEHRLILHLSEAMGDKPDSLVQPVLADENGETAIVLGEWSYEVHPVARGIDVYEEALSWTPFLSSGHAHAAGRAMARLHQAAQGYDAPARASRQLVTSFTIFAGDALKEVQDSPVARMGDYLATRPLLASYVDKRDWQGSLDGLLLPFYSRLRPWLRYLMPLWTHNDLHASNLTWTSSEADAAVANVIDFGLADRTNAIHDLATTIERNIVEWLRMDEAGVEVVHLDHLDALLRGYEDLVPLSYEQARALVAMLPLVHCEFALSETDYFLTILHSEEKARLAYEGYFLAHAEWFHSAQGQKLTEHLERWVEQAPRMRAVTP